MCRSSTGLRGRLAAVACARCTTAGLASRLRAGQSRDPARRWADEFLRFCQANPSRVRWLGLSDAGSAAIPVLGADLDIRTDLRATRVWHDGETPRRAARSQIRVAATIL